MKTLPTLPFLFFLLLLCLSSCVPEHQAMDPYEGSRSDATFVVDKPSEGLSAFYDQDSEKIIGFLASESYPVKIRIYDISGHFIFGENISLEYHTYDFNIDFRKNNPGQYQIKVEFENGDHFEQWLSVEKRNG